MIVATTLPCCVFESQKGEAFTTSTSSTPGIPGKWSVDVYRRALSSFRLDGIEVKHSESVFRT